MKMKLLSVPTLMAVMSALVVINSGQTTRPTDGPTTTVRPVLNLNGKMFTLSRNKGGISFYHPSYDPSYFYPRPTTTKPITGVSVCLRHMTDYPSYDYRRIFTLSPSNPLGLDVSHPDRYKLSRSSSSSFGAFGSSGWNNDDLYLRPEIRFRPNNRQDIWTRVCVTVDSMKNVAQMFSGFNMSIRKRLQFPYVWSGEPMIEFPGFDGQVTDVQVWDYPLSFREILNYMSGCVSGPCSGSALSWSHISYSPKGDPVLEDTYESQAKQPISSRGRGRRPKGEKKKTREFVKGGESTKKKRQQL